MEEQKRYEVQRQVGNFEEFAMSVDSVVRQVQLIQNVLEKVMQKDEHFGIIPGTKKPTLYKPGAEKLCMTFRLSPEYEIVREIQQAGLISYTVRCTLTHMPTGQMVATGMGSCNTREEKYRWEYKLTPTETPVPKEYWEAKKAGNNQECKRILGDGKRPMKIEETGQWMIATAEKIENDNAWDYDNTVLKMSCKRALIAAVLNGTAASDIFTQDIDDDDKGKPEAEAAAEKGLKEPGKKKADPPPADKKADGTVTVKISDVQSKAGKKKDGTDYTIYTIVDEAGTKYGTFSDTLADLARSSQPDGIPVTITYAVGQYGNKITTLELAEREVGQEG